MEREVKKQKWMTEEIINLIEEGRTYNNCDDKIETLYIIYDTFNHLISGHRLPSFVSNFLGFGPFSSTSTPLFLFDH